MLLSLRGSSRCLGMSAVAEDHLLSSEINGSNASASFCRDLLFADPRMAFLWLILPSVSGRGWGPLCRILTNAVFQDFNHAAFLLLFVHLCLLCLVFLLPGPWLAVSANDPSLSSVCLPSRSMVFQGKTCFHVPVGWGTCFPSPPWQAFQLLSFPSFFQEKGSTWHHQHTREACSRHASTFSDRRRFGPPSPFPFPSPFSNSARSRGGSPAVRANRSSPLPSPSAGSPPISSVTRRGGQPGRVPRMPGIPSQIPLDRVCVGFVRRGGSPLCPPLRDTPETSLEVSRLRIQNSNHQAGVRVHLRTRIQPRQPPKQAPEAVPAAMTKVDSILQENPDRFCMFPITYHRVWEMYKQAEASFWTGEWKCERAQRCPNDAIQRCRNAETLRRSTKPCEERAAS